MAEPTRLTPFEPIRLYDAPGIALSNLIDGEFSLRGTLDAFVAPQRLSPSERSTFETRLKALAGGNPLTDALIGLATNPFIWLGMAFMPSGKGALKYGLGNGKPGRIFNGMVQGIPGLHLLGHATEEMDGTAMNVAAVVGLGKGEDLAHEWEAPLVKLQANLAHALGEKKGATLASMSRSKNKRTRQVIEAVFASLQGHDREHVFRGKRFIPEFWMQNGDVLQKIDKNEELLKKVHQQYLHRASSGNLGDGIHIFQNSKGDWDVVPVGSAHPGESFRVQVKDPAAGEWRVSEEIVPKKLDIEDGGLDSWLENVLPDGIARKLRDQLKVNMRRRALRLLAKDSEIEGLLASGKAPTREQMDKDKIKRLWRAKYDLGHAPDLDPWEADLSAQLFSPEIRNALQRRSQWVQSGKDFKSVENALEPMLSYKEWEENLMEAASTKLSQTEYYMPRNVTGHYTREHGRELKYLRPHEVEQAATKTEGITGITGRTHERVEADPIWGERTLRKYEDLFDDLGWTKGSKWAEWSGNSRRKLNARVDGGYMDDDGSWVNTDRVKGPVRALEMDGIKQLSRFESDTRQDLLRTFHIHAGDPDGRLIIDEQRRLFALREEQGWPNDRPDYFVEGRMDLPHEDSRVTLLQDFRGKAGVPEGGFTMADLEAQSFALIGSVPDGMKDTVKYRSGTLRDVVLPYMYGRYNPGKATRMYLTHMSQRSAGWLANGWLGQQLEKAGLGDLMGRLRSYADDDPEVLSAKLARGESSTLGYLYGAALGGNMASVVIQFLQPYIGVAGHAGFANTFKAHVTATKEVLNYIRERAAMGPNADPEKVRRLMRKSFEFPEETKLIGHVLEDIEQFATSHYVHAGGWQKFWLQDVPLYAFGKAEWVNRLTTFHAVKNLYKEAPPYKGKPLIELLSDGRVDKDSEGYAALRADANRMVIDTQFPGGPMNTPKVLASVPPLLRQFMTFGARAAISPFRMPSRINQGVRYTSWGQKLPSWLPAAVPDTLRLLGVSSALWEVGNAFGLDPSYGLFADATTSLVGDDEILDRGARTIPFQLPPAAALAINLPMGMLQWLGTGDYDILRNNLARAIPMGVASQRLLGIAPQTGIPVLKGLQKTYADYSNPSPTGTIPLYKWDGSLIGFESPARLVLQGLGLDVGAHKKGQEIEEYLVKNREEIVGYKQKYLSALYANNVPKAQSIAREYQTRFQLPLTLSKAQVRAYGKNREAPRPERLLDTMPSDMRPQYMEMLKDRAAKWGLTEEAFLGGATSAKRSSVYQRLAPPLLNPESLAEMQRSLEQAKVVQGINEMTFKGLQQ